jgi:pimeloyl-ACP methyl ester carboxylesterase
MKKFIKISLSILVIAFLIYISGPQPERPKYILDWPEIPALDGLDTYISAIESQHHLKKDNQARIVWANDTMHAQTDYAIVYLHGFSASQAEGDPVHRNLAKAFDCNLYLSRLAEHGIDTTEQLLNLTPDNYWESAKQALAIGRKLGKKVILMGTSTGATQALQLAATYPDKVDGLILYSPNIAIRDPNAWLLNNPWGLDIARIVKKGKYHDPADNRPEYAAYWNKPYRLEAIVSLQEMLETTMQPALFQRVYQPTLMLFYYKDEQHQDEVVRVDAMKKMFNELGTESRWKQAVPIPDAGDHVLASPIKSNAVDKVESITRTFLLQKLGMKLKS